ncbi:hypothetical protein K440DRAFT_658414 [Wilcoxina mikolae CBS 423.85]|nr:hypothetical protein K440DRAFT_658414 [Wilcoxina mikolae CBS 423.85]
MVEKRKRSSTIHARSLSTTKRQSTTPAPQPTPPPPKPDFPTSFDRDGPLPVLPTCQSDNLSLQEFKSVAESKVLAESLLRSTRKWVDGDIFEKYWIKPLKSRKLDPAIIEKNPGKDTMVKLGNATMHCMPHKFDIRLYQVLRPVKEPPPPPPQVAQQPQQPHPQPLVQQPQPSVQANHVPPAPIPQSPSTSAPVSRPMHTQQAQVPPVQPIPQSQQAAQTLGAPMYTAPQPSHIAGPPQQIPHHAGPPQSHPAQPHPVVQPAVPNPQNAPPRPPQPGQPFQQHPPQVQVVPLPPPPPRPDPVIQMLAMKAATDVKLKELMRIVASGKATREQLQEFQGYIDTLTAASNNPPIGPPGSQTRPPQQPPQPPRQQFPPQQQFHSHGQPTQPQMQMYPMQHQPQMYQHPPQQMTMRQYQQPLQPPAPVQQRPPPQPKARAFPQPPRQEICGIVFEFIDSYSQGDRFHFPKHAILEYQNRNTTVIASFIVTRTPEGYNEEFYQPVTITLESAYPKILEHLKMVVADPDTTRSHMKQIIATKKRVNDTYLVYRLRREPGEVVPDKAFVEARMDPPPRSKEAKNARDTSTPMRDTKSGGNSAQPRTGPKVKHVKKHTPKLISTPTTTTASNDSPVAAATTTSSASSAGGGGASVNETTIFAVDLSPPPEQPRPPRLPKPPRSRKGRIADPTKNCHICQTSKTSLWRKADIEGENVTVCNACGIKWKTNAQKQAQIAAAVAQGLPIPIFPGDERRSSGAGGQRPSLESLQQGGPQMWMEGVESVTGQVFATGIGSSPPAPPPPYQQGTQQPPPSPVQHPIPSSITAVPAATAPETSAISSG